MAKHRHRTTQPSGWLENHHETKKRADIKKAFEAKAEDWDPTWRPPTMIERLGEKREK